MANVHASDGAGLVLAARVLLTVLLPSQWKWCSLCFVSSLSWVHYISRENITLATRITDFEGMDQCGLELFLLAPAKSVGPRRERWVARFKNYLVAANITADARKKAQLLHIVEGEVFDIFCSLPVVPDSYSTAWDAFIKHFSPKKNTEFEIFQFHSAWQMPSETAMIFLCICDDWQDIVHLETLTLR